MYLITIYCREIMNTNFERVRIVRRCSVITIVIIPVINIRLLGNLQVQ